MSSYLRIIIKRGVKSPFKNSTMKKQTYTYQNFDRQDLYSRVHTSFDWAIKSVDEINKRIRANYKNGVISRSELNKTVIGFIKGNKSTYCV